MFHVVQNHPFLDGNKRIAVAALVFLDLDGVEMDAPKGSVYRSPCRSAMGEACEAQVAEFFRLHAH